MSSWLSGARVAIAALVAVAGASLAGCGGDDSTAAEDVPSLGALLESVDDAIADGRYVVARRQLDALVEATIESRNSGDLDDGKAENILAAAAQLRALLPEPLPQVPEDEPTTLSPTPEPDGDGGGRRGGGGGGDGGDGGGDGGGGGGGGKDDKPGKGKGKGKGRGNGNGH